jgi:RNA polymerase sigma-70 factor (ECF subfamily)
VPAELVEDSFQQVFLIVSERLDDIVSGKERSFVYGVTLRVARTYRRYEGREELGEEADLRAAHQLSQDSMLDTRRLLQACDAILAALRPELREAFVLHDLEQLSGAEIARLLDIPEGTVHTRLRRARLLVRGELQELEASASTMEARRG